jgi:hypothetical protein
MFGANPTIASYTANTVKMYNAKSSPVRFENKYFLLLLKNALAYYLHTTLALYVVVNSKMVGFGSQG